jgi:hypothetical protein
MNPYHITDFVAPNMLITMAIAIAVTAVICFWRTRKGK